MTIVIPMAGLSKRFLDAGYTLPKYMLYVAQKSLFQLSVNSFSNYFDSCKFLFIARDIYDTPLFIKNECKLLNIKNFEVIILEEPTKGQAETVYLGLNKANISINEPITIFNIDTIHHGFTFPKNIEEWDGYLEVFYGEGSNWSYAKTESANSTRVVETTEKNPISNYCSTGLYYFISKKLFMEAYTNTKIDERLNEYYIAPMYNELIKNQKEVHIHLVEKNVIEICGTPVEYEDYLNKYYEKK